jgi:hypothetical protein
MKRGRVVKAVAAADVAVAVDMAAAAAVVAMVVVDTAVAAAATGAAAAEVAATEAVDMVGHLSLLIFPLVLPTDLYNYSRLWIGVHYTALSEL